MDAPRLPPSAFTWGELKPWFAARLWGLLGAAIGANKSAAGASSRGLQHHSQHQPFFDGQWWSLLSCSGVGSGRCAKEAWAVQAERLEAQQAWLRGLDSNVDSKFARRVAKTDSKGKVGTDTRRASQGTQKTA